MKEQENKSILIRKLIRRRKVRNYTIADKLSLSRPTYTKKINDPNLLTGHERTILAEQLGLPIDILDEIINRNYIDVGTTEILLDLVTPLP